MRGGCARASLQAVTPVLARLKGEHILQSARPGRAALMATRRHCRRGDTGSSNKLSCQSALDNERRGGGVMKSERTNERKRSRPAWHQGDSTEARHNFQCGHFFSLSSFPYRRVIFWCPLPGSAPVSPFVPDAVLVALSLASRLRKNWAETTTSG